MFSQPPEEEPICNTTSETFKSNARSRRQRKLRRMNKLKAIKKYQNQITTKQKAEACTPVPSIPITMTSWAEDFTKATTWQLKKEVAFWKSKAKALEQENKILHITIRQNSIRKKYSSDISDSDSEPAEREEDPAPAPEWQWQWQEWQRQVWQQQEWQRQVWQQQVWQRQVWQRQVGQRQVVQRQVVQRQVVQPNAPEFEVSEEYIQFLRDNQVYRDFARQERERMKAQSDVEKKQIEEMEAGPSEKAEDRQETLKKLYGDAWEKISALEMSLKTQCISICDQDKPMYWPNIPFNLRFG